MVYELSHVPDWATSGVEWFFRVSRARPPAGKHVLLPHLGSLSIPEHIQKLDKSRSTKAMMVARRSCSKCGKLVPLNQPLPEAEFETQGTLFKIMLCSDCWEAEGLPPDGSEGA